MRFTKMHGLGNDYVYLDGWDVQVPEDAAPLALSAIAIAVLAAMA